ncbi:hypothetical protein FHR85_000868 [Alkalibacillus almallahensis]|nr:hypothetical protein [Alkalibacillus almallahensis]
MFDNQNPNDTFDRGFFGSPGCMIILILAIIIISVISNW